MIELNVSCPNVETGLVMGADPAETARAVERVRPLSDKPLIVKLTPNATEPAAVAAAAEEAGADAVSLINTLKGMALDPRRRAAVARRGHRRPVGAGGARGRARAGARRGARGRDPGDRHGRHRERPPTPPISCRAGAACMAVGHRELPRSGAPRGASHGVGDRAPQRTVLRAAGEPGTGYAPFPEGAGSSRRATSRSEVPEKSLQSGQNAQVPATSLKLRSRSS